MSAIGADKESQVPYAKTKGMAEEEVLKCGKGVIIRPSLVFGKEDDFFNRFATLSKFLPFMPVFGGGQSKFQPVYVKDLARVVALASVPSNTSVVGKIIEVGGPKVYTYKEIMQMVLDITGRWRPVISLPWMIGMLQASILQLLPPNLFTLTTDQIKLLKKDNIVDPSLVNSKETSGTVATTTALGIDAQKEFLDPKEGLKGWLK